MLQIANIRVKLNELKECLDESVRSQDFARAAEIKHNISELETERNQLLDLPQTQTEEIRTEKVGKRKCKVIFFSIYFQGWSPKYKCKWKLVFVNVSFGVLFIFRSLYCKFTCVCK